MTIAATIAIPSPAASPFHTATDTAFIDLEIDGHRKTWPKRGTQFRAWSRRRFYKEAGGALGAEPTPSPEQLPASTAEITHVRSLEQQPDEYL